jgi:hypothetical protein
MFVVLALTIGVSCAASLVPIFLDCNYWFWLCFGAATAWFSFIITFVALFCSVLSWLSAGTIV